MGSASSKFKKYLQHGDEFAAMQVFQSSPELRSNLDPSASYGESHSHNTPLHYAAKHGMKHLLRTFLSDLGGNPNKKNADDETAVHCVCRVGQAKSPSAEDRRAACIVMILQWRGPLLQDGEKERVQLNAQDKKGNTALHYASASGLQKCVELLVVQGAGLFLENRDRLTPCDLAVRLAHHDVATYLESRMVFADSCDGINESELIGHEGEAEGDNEVYSGLRAQDLQEAKDQLLVETADMLHIPLFTAEALLRDNEWSKALLLEKWMTNAVQCCEEAGIAPPASALQLVACSPPLLTPSPPSSIITPPPPPHIPGGVVEQDECEICYGEMRSWELQEHGGASCKHQFCATCWESYLSLKIQEGGAHHILCPAVRCNILVDVDFIEKMVSPEIARKYLQFDIQAFVERNKTIKWCPLPGCGRAVKFPEAELETQPFYFPNTKPPPKTSHAVDCGNGHFFCWECLGEAHSPSGCEQWVEWQSKVAEVKPEELRISSGETEDAANFLWLVTNSKPCPNCKSPIQKNEGCNHMKCSKCKFDFCWVCLESWKKHSSATGGYFRCNRFDAQSKADEKLGVMLSEATMRNHQMQELNRFIHYYTRFKNHQNSLKMEEPLLKSARDKMEVLATSLPSQEQQGQASVEKGTRFVEEGVKELLKARRVLCGSYVYGYYLEDNGYNKTIFEYMQNELEEVTEKLSEMVARQYLVTPRRQIIATTLLARRRRHKFVRAVSRGLLPPETPPALRRARKRRLPGLVGMDPPDDMENVEAMSRTLDPSQPWVKDSRGCHTNLAALLDWPDLDSDEEESNLNQALTLTLLGKCSRKACPRPRARNPRTGTIHDYCSLHCAQRAKYLPEQGDGESSSSSSWEVCDSSMELLIALEMSRLQMIEDEARRRLSWLQEHSREQGWDGSGDTRPQQGCVEGPVLPGTSVANSSIFSYEVPCGSRSQSGGGGSGHSEASAWIRPELSEGAISYQPSSAEIAVDYFLKKLANKEISQRNLNIEKHWTDNNKVEKDLLCFPKTTAPGEMEDGLFQYGDLHENSRLLPPLDLRRDLRRSQSLGDLKTCEETLCLFDVDHAHQDHPEESLRRQFAAVAAAARVSIEDEGTESGGDVENTDPGGASEIIGDMDSPLMDLEVRGILSHLEESSDVGGGEGSSEKASQEPSFQLVVDEGTDKDESNSTEQSSSATAANIKGLRIHISHSAKLEGQSSNEYESETGIPNSPTLYISGVSICRSPEPRSPKVHHREVRSPSLTLPLCCTPEPRLRLEGRLDTSPLPIYSRSRSSSLVVPSSSNLSPRVCARASGTSLHLSSLSLQATRATSPFLTGELRVSRSASEPEKGRLVFQFPKSPTDGALSSVLHVEESNLSSDDFHEALFLGKSPKPVKKKRSKNERNKGAKERSKNEKDGKERSKGKDKAKDNGKEGKERKDSKDKRKTKELTSTV
ncbi:ankyrin repeat and IBR domain-containing protein 1-like isoform X2 [Portunus trituberculatus]|uniref:ankyrin repeat and IBR domain-containing protein 1-like isoform X2 n=1 Tax=Portunus trituberculatus TaxID=210409 RepID=UPI001E1CDB17|nr:ankyrin repeat and IBR domain-containing protein 1-like isoform X2 [Portunus trituberculatus]